jgi:4'-phosphopantetheinyl transferase
MVETLINKPYLKLFWVDIEAPKITDNPLLYTLKADQAKAKLIQHLYQQPFAIKKDDFGKPFIDEIDEHISISHTKNACSILFTRDSNPGLDIELERAQLFRIKSKYLSSTEQQKHDISSLKTLTILWAAKEAIFKWHGIGEVNFKAHSYIQHIDFENDLIQAQFLKTGYETDIQLHFLEHKEHVIVYVKSTERI